MVTEVTRLSAKTVPLVLFPVGCLAHAYPEKSYAMEGQTVKMGGTRPRSCVVLPRLTHRVLHVLHQSFTVEVGSVSSSPGGVTAHGTALTAVMRTTVVSAVAGNTEKCNTTSS